MKTIYITEKQYHFGVIGEDENWALLETKRVSLASKK
jgi:hypothetical protein